MVVAVALAGGRGTEPSQEWQGPPSRSCQPARPPPWPACLWGLFLEGAGAGRPSQIDKEEWRGGKRGVVVRFWKGGRKREAAEAGQRDEKADDRRRVCVCVEYRW